MDIDKQIQKLKIELAMSGYHDGWTAEWIREKLAELEEIKKKQTNSEQNKDNNNE